MPCMIDWYALFKTYANFFFLTLSKVSSQLTALITFNHSSLMLRKTVDSLLYRQHQEVINYKVKSESNLAKKKAKTPDFNVRYK